MLYTESTKLLLNNNTSNVTQLKSISWYETDIDIVVKNRCLFLTLPYDHITKGFALILPPPKIMNFSSEFNNNPLLKEFFFFLIWSLLIWYVNVYVMFNISNFLQIVFLSFVITSKRLRNSIKHDYKLFCNKLSLFLMLNDPKYHMNTTIFFMYIFAQRRLMSFNLKIVTFL